MDLYGWRLFGKIELLISIPVLPERRLITIVLARIERRAALRHILPIRQSPVLQLLRMAIFL